MTAISLADRVRGWLGGNKKLLGGILIGLITALSGNYIWQLYLDSSQYRAALNEALIYRGEFRTDGRDPPLKREGATSKDHLNT